MAPTVSILILNWNGWEDTLECLESLYQINYPDYNVIVVDNHSEDDSLNKIKEYSAGGITVGSKFFDYDPVNKPIRVFEYAKEDNTEDTKKGDTEYAEEENTEETEESNTEYAKEDAPEANINFKKEFLNLPSNQRLIILKNDENYGFAEGNNIGIKYILNTFDSDYIMLLNNDTVVNKEFLNQLVKIAETDPKIGILGPKIYYYDFQGQSNVVANLCGKINLSRYPGYYDITETSDYQRYHDDEKRYNGVIECDWVSGAALLMKSKDLPLKTLNRDLFFGCEDIDLALRLKEYGYKSVVVSDSHIWHKEGISRKKRSSASVRRALMEIKSNLTFLKAHNGRYYWFLPLYFLQIAKIYLLVMLKR